MTRQMMLDQLKADQTFDLLVIGGGATGCGIALDAASRGLKVALVEKNDFSEGTSSRSTKLVHGGVRYLEKAVKQLDKAQYDLVREGLHERGILLKNAPHLAGRIAFVTPIYSWFEIPYVYAGLKFYDILSGKMSLGGSQLLTRKTALKKFPMLKADGLKAAVMYYDGQFNDARMAVSLALTARSEGAVIANHVEVTGLVKSDTRVRGAEVRDRISGESFIVNAKSVVNATGPFCDRLRQLDDPQAKPMVKASSGIHLVLDKRFVPDQYGLMIPKTEDGRVLFMLPWEGHTLVGTTDDPASVNEHPEVTEAEIEYVLRHVRLYSGLDVQRSDVKATWSGLRPLIDAEGKNDTQSLVRDHVTMTSPSGFVTICGGKWTNYRHMAEVLVDRVVADFHLSPQRPCATRNLPVLGGDKKDPGRADRLAKSFDLTDDVAQHLARAYGSASESVARLCRDGLSGRLHPDHPYLEGEVVYVAKQEMAERAMDVLTRRLPLALLDQQAAREALPRVLDLLQQEFGWDETRLSEEMQLAEQRLVHAL